QHAPCLSRRPSRWLSTSRRKNVAGAGAVGLHLRDKRLAGVELAVGADEVDELDLDVSAIEVTVEVEQEDLEHRHAVIIGRARAEIGSAVVDFAVDVDAYGIDPVAERRAARQRYVGGRKT